MSEFKIDDDVPVPAPSGRKSKGYSKYPFRELKNVGQSFFVPNVSTSTLSARIAKWRAELGWEFTAKSTTENGVSGVRVWRIK